MSGINVHSEKIDSPVELNTVKIYAASPDAPAQVGLIRNFKVAHGRQGLYFPLHNPML